MVEQLGSGVPRILESYPKECFKFSENFLRMTFPVVQAENQKGEDNVDISSGAIGGVIGGAIEDLTDRQKEVLAIIKQDNKISYRAIAHKLEINESAVSKHIELLKEKEHIERVGGTRGYWKVTTSNLD